MKNLIKKHITIIYFQIGVNIIGLPEFHKNIVSFNDYYAKQKSKFF